jgi:tetratricopeptide (TPR) repeat protein
MPTVAEIFDQAWQYCQAGAFSQAETLYRQVLKGVSAYAEPRFFPLCAQAHFNLGVVLANQGKIGEAIGNYRQAVRFNPNMAEAHNNLANALQTTGQMTEALASYQQALRCRPENAEALNNFGTALTDLGRVEEAIDCFRKALRIKDQYAAAHSNLGEALKRLGRLDDALASLQRAIEIDPRFPEAQNTMGDTLKCLGHRQKALAHFEEALKLRPDFGRARYNRALMWLQQGDLDRGWKEYEWRWTERNSGRRAFRQPLWDGTSLLGKTILLHAEQGLGDTFQFIRYLPLVKARGGRVIVECQPALHRFLSHLPGIDELITRGSPLPTYDVHAPLGSLPGIFRTTLDTVPNAVPYLRADSQLVHLWQKHLKTSGVRCPESGVRRKHVLDTGHRTPDTGRFFVGISWQGNPAYGLDRHRSILLQSFAPLAQIEGVQLISLQKGPGTEQLQALTPDTGLRTPDFEIRTPDGLDETSSPFMDTAAIMMSLDLVITSDTAIPHLAGAMGVPVWVALPAVADWRWLLDRDDIPWYPTMRLFRQTEAGNWQDVFERMAAALRQH